MVDVVSGNGYGMGSLPLVDLRVHTKGIPAPVIVEVLGNELVGTCILFYNVALPGKEIRNQFPLELLVFGSQAGIDGAADIGKILPGIDSVAPVVQSPGII